MPRKKKTNGDQPIGIGYTSKQMKRKKPISNTYLIDIEPITDNQKKLFDSYSAGKQLVAYGTAGTGKTFISLYNALADILDESTPYEKIYLVRSLVSTREIGFLQEITRIKQTFIKYHTKIWLNICSKCHPMLILRCYMAILRHKTA